MKRSVILTDRLGPDISSAFWTKGQVLHKPYTTPNSSIRSDEGLTLETSAFQTPKQCLLRYSLFMNKGLSLHKTKYAGNCMSSLELLLITISDQKSACMCKVKISICH